MRIAVMQPAFVPFLGYFRLFERTDLFVIYDCAQFPRRWFCHRNKLLDRNRTPQWFTVPLEKAPQDTLIHHMRMATDARSRMREQMRRFPAFETLANDFTPLVLTAHGALVTYLVELLEACCQYLGIKWNVVYSSALGLPADLRGQDRILAICEKMGAKHYLNSPGGRDLYDMAAFAKRGIQLEFLPPWEGEQVSILQTIAEDMNAQR